MLPIRGVIVPRTSSCHLRLALRSVTTKVSKSARVSRNRRLLSLVLPDRYDEFDYSGWKPRKRNSKPQSDPVKLPFVPSSSYYQPISHRRIDQQSILDDNNVLQDLVEIPSPATREPTTLSYDGLHVMPITSKLHIVKPDEDIPRGVWPVFRLMVGERKNTQPESSIEN
jgi:hypothetical protein